MPNLYPAAEKKEEVLSVPTILPVELAAEGKPNSPAEGKQPESNKGSRSPVHKFVEAVV